MKFKRMTKGNDYNYLHESKKHIPLHHFDIVSRVKRGPKSPLFVYRKMDLAAQIKQLADRHLAQSSHFVLNVRVIDRLKPPKITVVLDGDQGIAIDDCANLSRALSDFIHETALLEDYNLEVTTPGIDQPLKLLRQFQKHIGRTLKIELMENEVVRGKLLQIENNEVIIEEESKLKGKLTGKNIRRINFDQIDKTFVMVSFK